MSINSVVKNEQTGMGKKMIYNLLYTVPQRRTKRQLTFSQELTLSQICI